MEKRIWLSPPHLSGDEIKYIQQAFNDNWVAPAGPFIDKFEENLCNYLNCHHATALSSGTAAIHLALLVLGIKPGDEVICPSFTFAATANPVIYVGATPIFIDSEFTTWNMSPEFLEAAIKARIQKGKKPVAIIAVHLYGIPALMDKILAIGDHYEIPVIEDAAEALGSEWQNQKVGTLGHLGIFSFNGNKIITTSSGGALVSNNSSYIEKAKYLATQAKDPLPYYHHSEIGYNYRMSNILAGIGIGQLEVLTERINKKREIFSTYQNFFSVKNSIQFCHEQSGAFSNRWLTCILTRDDKGKANNEKIRLALERENIESRPLWKPLHLQPAYKKYPYYGEGICENLFNEGLCLPSGSSLSSDDLEKISSVILEQF